MGNRVAGLNRIGRRACNGEKAKRVKESPAKPHRNDCDRGFLMENGVGYDAGEKRGTEERDDYGRQAEGDKTGRRESCEDKCDTADRSAGPATARDGSFGTVLLIKPGILPVVQEGAKKVGAAGRSEQQSDKSKFPGRVLRGLVKATCKEKARDHV